MRRAIVPEQSPAVLDRVDEGELGARVDGLGSGEVRADPGDGSGASRGREWVEAHMELVAHDLEIGRGADRLTQQASCIVLRSAAVGTERAGGRARADSALWVAMRMASWMRLGSG